MAIMTRNKEFDTEAVLDRAMECFHVNGYRATSMDMLTAAMDIGKGSLYAAFGGKQALFQAALERYAHAVVDVIVGRLESAKQPSKEIASLLRDVARIAAADRRRLGCLVTNTATEIGNDNKQVGAAVQRTFKQVEDGFYRALKRAQELGEIDPDKNPRALARFLTGIIQGLRVVGRINAEPAVLNDIVDSALACLK
jgi:TetR/AcrR family transcriptional repressor of nem operon